MIKKILPICFFVLYLGIKLYGQTIEIHQIDVGTGDATLIKVHSTTGQKNILIDAGQKGAASIVINYLKDSTYGNLGPKPYLDYVISSHYHDDHIGGFVGNKKRDTSGCYKYPGILGTSQLEYYAVLDKGDAKPIPGSQVFKDYITLATDNNNIDRRVTVGTTVVGQGGAVNSITPPAHMSPPPAPVNQDLSLGGYINLGVDANGVAIRLRLVVADAYVYDPNANPQYYDVADSLGINRNSAGGKANPNNWGLAWVLEYGKFRYFTGGDLGGYNAGAYMDIETPLSTTLPVIYPNPASAQGHICAFKISHHGSQESSNPVFLDTLKSTSIAFSSGPKTTFSHPKQSVLNRIDTASWNRANLNYVHTVGSYFTELNFIRDISPTKAATSGNVAYVLTGHYVPPAIIADSTQMANGLYLYELDKTVAGEVDGNIVTEVYPTNTYNHQVYRISALSYFKVKIRYFNGGGWTGFDEFVCHD